MCLCDFCVYLVLCVFFRVFCSVYYVLLFLVRFRVYCVLLFVCLFVFVVRSMFSVLVLCACCLCAFVLIFVCLFVFCVYVVLCVLRRRFFDGGSPIKNSSSFLMGDPPPNIFF